MQMSRQRLPEQTEMIGRTKYLRLPVQLPVNLTPLSHTGQAFFRASTYTKMAALNTIVC